MRDTLPPNPSLDHLKHQARDLHRAHAAGNAEALERVQARLPDYEGRLILAKAQTVIAREYGFDSWVQLRTHLFAAVDRFCAAAFANDVAQLGAMLDEDPRLINALDRKGWNAFAHARGRESVAFLQERGAVYVEKLRGGGWDGLNQAVWFGEVDKVRELIEAKGDLSQVGHSGVLHYAAIRGNVELLELLLEKGGKALLEVRFSPHQDTRESGLKPLQYAARTRGELIARILIGYGAHYDIFSAVALGDGDRVGALIDADPKLLDSRDDYDSTLLHWAAQAGRGAVVDFLVEQGADVTARNLFGETPLIMATIERYDKIRRLGSNVTAQLVERGADVDIFAAAAMGETGVLGKMLEVEPAQARATNEYGTTPLHLAAWNGHTEAARLLLEQGADPSAEDRGGCPPLYYGPYWGQHAEVTELLLQYGADLQYKNIWDRGHEAIDNGSNLDDVYYMARQGGQAIHRAAMGGDVERVRSLLEEDGDRLNRPNNMGAAPIHFAAAANQVAVLALLCQRGVNVDMRTVHPPKQGASSVEADFGYTPFFLAVHAGALEAVDFLLAQGADLYVQCKRWSSASVLHGMAIAKIERGDVEGTVGRLVEAGMDVDVPAPGRTDTTPLHRAAICGKVRLAACLLHHGADVNHPDGEGNTPLHRAPMHGSQPLVDMMGLLIEHGADVNARNSAGETPLDIALKPKWAKADPEAAELLRHHGGQRGVEV
ncbi:MAG: hypothetical protein GKR89_10575 [Candidatus Latescibacteria bacterium]|nr:hypothetical protein [Candidatus Latescibacterota bacterium]